MRNDGLAAQFGAFNVVALPQGGFLAGGTKDRGLWLSRFDADGNARWTEFHDPAKSAELEMTLQVILDVGNGSAAAIYSALIVNGRHQKGVIRVLHFPAT